MGARTCGGRVLCAYPSPQCVTLREALHGTPSGLSRAFVQGFVRRDVALREKNHFAFNQLLTKRTFTNFDFSRFANFRCRKFAYENEDENENYAAELQPLAVSS